MFLSLSLSLRNAISINECFSIVLHAKKGLCVVVDVDEDWCLLFREIGMIRKARYGYSQCGTVWTLRYNTLTQPEWFF